MKYAACICEVYCDTEMVLYDDLWGGGGSEFHHHRVWWTFHIEI